MTTFDGVDVASYQHPGGVAIDWAAVASTGITFAAVKATGENGYVNPFFAADWAGIKAAGIPVRMAYHFLDARPTKDQTDQFFATVGPLGQGDLVALDVETTAAIPVQPVGSIVALLHAITARFGRSCVNYQGYYYPGASSIAYDSFPLWLPAYQAANPRSYRPPMIWQYSSAGAVAGILGNVDQNMIMDRPALLALAQIHTRQPGDDDMVNVFNDGATQFAAWGLYKLPIRTTTDLTNWQYLAQLSGGKDVGRNDWLATQLVTVDNLPSVAPSLDQAALIAAIKALPAAVIAALKAAL